MNSVVNGNERFSMSRLVCHNQTKPQEEEPKLKLQLIKRREFTKANINPFEKKFNINAHQNKNIPVVKTFSKQEIDVKIGQKKDLLRSNRAVEDNFYRSQNFQEKMYDSRDERVLTKLRSTSQDWGETERSLKSKLKRNNLLFEQHYTNESCVDQKYSNLPNQEEAYKRGLRNYS